MQTISRMGMAGQPAAEVLEAFARGPAVLGPDARAKTAGAQTAAGLIGEVSGAIALLTRQCAEYQQVLCDTQQRTQTEVERAKLKAEHWRKLALALRVRLNRLTDELPALQDRVAVAERRVTTTRAVAERAARAAAETDAVAALLPHWQARASTDEASITAGASGGLRERLDTVVGWIDALRDLSQAGREASGAIDSVPDAA